MPQQAYTLPPDKLAKAIALSRIRDILDIAGSLWGIVVLWLLLATRGCVPGWRAGRSGFRARRWIQGLIFFAGFSVIADVASLPLDGWASTTSALTGSACRAGEAGLATRQRRWG